MKVLVTGANGFLGTWLCHRLVKDGYQVSVLVRPKSDLGEMGKLPVTVCHGDVTDLESLKKALKGIEAVFHLAGVVAYSKDERAQMEAVNVVGTQNLLLAMQANQVKKLLHVSSVAAIGAGLNDQQILNEKSDFNLAQYDLGYFETKRKAEQIINEAINSMGIWAVHVNPSTIYGGGDSRKGSRSTQLKVARGQGLFYPMGGVSIVAVEDVVDGIMMAFLKGRSGERYILSGENLLVRDVFKIIAECAGVKAPWIPLPHGIMRFLAHLDLFLQPFGWRGPLPSERALVTTFYHWFDHSKATSELGFKPRAARLAIEQSVQWSKSNHLI